MKLNRLIYGSVLVASLLPAFANAATYYVRQGSTGNNSGTDWANAYPSLPSKLVRGDTYYISDGNYPAYTFDDPQSGTQTIVIKKATAADHGTNTGWQASYGDGQAIFNSVMRFTTGYYVFDGQVRNEADWFDGNSYGFRINHNNQDQNIVISGGSASSSITIKNVFVDAIYANLPSSTTIRRYAIDTDTYGGSIATNLVFSKMYVYGSNNVWFLRTTNGATVEYSASNGATGNAANHGEIVNLYYSGNNAIIRFNKFKNAYVNGGGTSLVAITYADGLQFYGNTADTFQVGDGSVGFLGGYSSRNRVFNNTFVNGTGACGMAWGSGSDNVVQNNLFVNCRGVRIEGSHDYNAFSDADRRGEANAQVNVASSIFVNFAGKDFRLASETNAGITLAGAYAKDMLGNTRGADGSWSRGAFERGSSSAGLPLGVPTSLTVK